MNKQALLSAYTLFPWLNKNINGFHTHIVKAGMNFILHGKNKEGKNRQKFYDNLSASLLYGRRQNWHLYQSYLKNIDDETRINLFAEWEEDDELADWKTGVMKAHMLNKDGQIDDVSDIMVGLAWDCYEAYLHIYNGAKAKQISQAEAQSWVILITAMAMKATPSYTVFLKALMRDIHWAYHQDAMDTSILKNKINRFIKEDLTNFHQIWDHQIFTGIEINGIVKKILFARARNESIGDIDDFASFTLGENIFDFLYQPNAFSVALNLLSVLNERPYMDYEADNLNGGHILWHHVDKETQENIFNTWLQNTANIEDAQNLEDIHQTIMVQGQHQEMGARLYWYGTLNQKNKRQLVDLLKKERKDIAKEFLPKLNRDILQFKLMKDISGSEISAVKFTIYDWLDDILFWRNGYLADIVDLDIAKDQITDIAQLILKNITGWDSLIAQIKFIYQFKNVGDKDDHALKLAWIDVMQNQPTGPVQNIILNLQKHYHISKDNQYLLERTHILSNDIRLFKPSPKTWALNIAAPLITPRQKLLIHDVASPYYRSENALFMRYNLGISTKEDLTENLNWLQSQGRRGMLKDIVHEYSQYDNSEIEAEVDNLTQMAGQPVGDLKYRIAQLEMIKENTEAVIQSRFWALDILRYSSLVQRGVVAKLISEAEAWPHLMAAASALQRRYNGWDDVLWDFYRAWIFDAALGTENSPELIRRKNIITNLLSPLNPVSFAYNHLSWDMPLGMPEIEIFSDEEAKESHILAQQKLIPTLH
ncbi:MAG: DUF1266 domain-containing protein [Alphaproteobacteria bacterium]